jgi:hypothetical protein
MLKSVYYRPPSLSGWELPVYVFIFDDRKQVCFAQRDYKWQAILFEQQLDTHLRLSKCDLNNIPRELLQAACVTVSDIVGYKDDIL